jgi:hypothetical protein
MSEQDSLTIVGKHLGLAVKPLRDALVDDDSFRTFAFKLGFDVGSIPPSWDAIRTAVQTLVAVADGAVPDVGPLLSALGQFEQVVINGSLKAPDGTDQTDAGARLFELLVADYLAIALPTVFRVLKISGVITTTPVPPAGTRPAFVETRLNYGAIPKLLTSPDAIVKAAFAWGTSNFAFGLLAHWLLEFAGARGFRAQIEEPSDAEVEGYQIDQSPEEPGLAVNVAFAEGMLGTAPFEVGVSLLNFPDDTNPGFIIQPLLPEQVTLPLPHDFRIEASANVAKTFGLIVRPLVPLELRYPFEAGTPSPTATMALVFAPTTPRILLGSENASRVEINGAKTSVTIGAPSGEFEVAAEVASEGMKVVLQASEGDGFISTLLGDRIITVPLGAAVRWSNRSGLSFAGSGKFEITLNPNLSLGPVTIPTLKIALRGQEADQTGRPTALIVELSAVVQATLGPVAVAVDQVGVHFDLQFRKGNLGAYNLDVGFKFPKGIGVFIDAGSVAGGGFLQIDQEAGRYSGALELRIYSISVKAFGLIETKVPGVSYSFVIVISAEFEPIQLGYGFMLLGIGGLIGINRSVNMDAVADAVRDGRLDHVLFPDDVVANAPQIISDLATLFPAAASKYVFGPMAKLTWLFLVNGTLGLLLEWPSKKVVILGTVRAALPRKDDAIVKLKMDVQGVLDFPKRHFELNASIDPEGSSAGGYTLSGDMAMRLDWGDRPNFALSVGGFNPGYTPPPGFPILRPMAIELGIEGNPRMTVKGYMALTSNTAQVGARLDAEFHKYGADVTGYLGFDALIVFSPFKFSASLVGGVHVSFMDVGFDLTLSGTLSGPAPWRLDGEICVGVWPFEACPDFHIQLTGEPALATLPKLDPWLGSPVGAAAQDQEAPGLFPAIKDLRNWQGVLDPGAFLGVTYRETGAPDAKLDPVGTATFRQKAVPLNYNITRFADTTPSRKGELKLGPVFIGAQATTITLNQDWFAPGRYREMSEAERLSTEAFEFLDAGVTIRSASVTIGTVAPRTINYQSFLMAADGSTTPLGLGHTPTATQLTGMATATSAARPPVRLLGAARFTDFTLARKLTDDLETYRVVNKTALTNAPNVGTSLTRSQATAALAALAGPALSTKQVYQIIANSHLGAA